MTVIGRMSDSFITISHCNRLRYWLQNLMTEEEPSAKTSYRLAVLCLQPSLYLFVTELLEGLG